jgi:predicted peroxiredoxin
MKLGIIITRDAFADRIVEIAKAAVKKGHSVSIFMTDDGVKLVRNNEIADLRNLKNTDVSLCDFSLRGRNIDEGEVPDGITAGTQYQNSLIHNECDKVLIF